MSQQYNYSLATVVIALLANERAYQTNGSVRQTLALGYTHIKILLFYSLIREEKTLSTVKRKNQKVFAQTTRSTGLTSTTGDVTLRVYRWPGTVTNVTDANKCLAS